MSAAQGSQQPVVLGIRQEGHGEQEGREFAEALIDSIHESLLVLNTDLRVQTVNQTFYRVFRMSEAETKDRLIYELGDGQWDIPELRQLLEEILPQNKTVEDYEVIHDFEQLGVRTMLLNARRLDHQQLILLAIEDVSEWRQAKEDLRALNKTLEGRIQQRTREVQGLASELTLAESRERSRIAQNLHDELQQQLHALQFPLKDLQRTLEDEAALATLNDAYDILLDAIQMAREVTSDLSPPLLPGEGLAQALQWLAASMVRRFGLTVEVRADSELSVPDEAVRTLLFSLVRELLFNVTKHAGVDRAEVHLRETDDKLEITVDDQGSGFDPGELQGGTGLGLGSAAQRLELFGGDIQINSKPGEGTRITIRVPLTSFTLS